MSDDTTGWGWYDDMIYDASPEGQIERLTAERDAARAAAKAWKAKATDWRKNYEFYGGDKRGDYRMLKDWRAEE